MTRNEESMWTTTAPCGWVAAQDLVDQVLEPFQDLLVEAVAAAGARSVLDVGCGTGGTTVAIAGRAAACTGIDVSPEMIDAARARAAASGSAATFITADAETHPFEPDAYDMAVSRFGVMFFADPVAAFTNLRRALRPGGAVCFIAWRSADENPFQTTAERAAAPLLPDLPPREESAPGQFAFADAGHVQDVFERAGWSAVELRPIDVPCVIPRSRLDGYLTNLGPVARALHDLDEDTRASVLATVRQAFDPFVVGDAVRFTAACWSVGARA